MKEEQPKPQPVFKFKDISTKILLMQCLKRRLKFIVRSTGFSLAEISRESKINIAYLVYIMKIDTKLVSDNVVRYLATSFEINSLPELFNPLKEKDTISRELAGPRKINSHMLIDKKSLWVWNRDYNVCRKELFNKALNSNKAYSLTSLIQSSGNIASMIKDETIISKQPVNKQNQFDFPKSIDIVETKKEKKKPVVQKEKSNIKNLYDELVKEKERLDAQLFALKSQLYAVESLMKIYEKSL